MTLLNLITLIKRHFPDATDRDICHYTNELESRLSDEIFSPAGMDCRVKPLDVTKDTDTPLLLDNEHLSLYINYIFAIISMQNSDFETSNIHSELFNQKISELAVQIRRTHKPIKNTPITGGDF